MEPDSSGIDRMPDLDEGLAPIPERCDQAGLGALLPGLPGRTLPPGGRAARPGRCGRPPGPALRGLRAPAPAPRRLGPPGAGGDPGARRQRSAVSALELRQAELRADVDLVPLSEV